VTSMLAAIATVGWKSAGGAFASSERGIIHRPVLVHLWPQTMIQPQYTMVHSILVKCTVQPTLHRVTTDRSECKARPGIMWVTQALGGREGVLRVHVCVECTHAPFGRQAMMDVVVGRILVAGASVVRKWLVVPESRMAHLLMVSASVLIVFKRTEAARA
jgi:hypothetical protein